MGPRRAGACARRAPRASEGREGLDRGASGGAEEGRGAAVQTAGPPNGGGTEIYILKNWQAQFLCFVVCLLRPQPAGARNTQSRWGKAGRIPKTAVVHNRERVRLVVRTILGRKIRVGSVLLAEGAEPERVQTAPAAGARLQTDAGRS